MYIFYNIHTYYMYIHVYVTYLHVIGARKGGRGGWSRPNIKFFLQGAEPLNILL